MHKVEISQYHENRYLKTVKNMVLQLSHDLECKVFLFGSRARNRYGFGADFDIGVEGLPDREFLRLKYQILERVQESIVPYEVDVVNFDKVSEDFKREAHKMMEVWQ
jgi:predicted nucleotidyltransferase